MLAEEAERPLPPLALAPIPQGVRYDAAGYPIGGDFSPASGMNLPVGGGEWSEDGPVVLEQAGMVRGVHLVRAVFYPVRPKGEHLRITTHLRASITFGDSIRASPSTHGGRPVLAALRSVVVN
jgi:hypothetical protein